MIKFSDTEPTIDTIHGKKKEMKVMLFDKIRNNHVLLMILCCALPIAAVLSLSYIGVLGSWGYYALFLLCPLSHFLMFRKGHDVQGKEVDNKGKMNE